MIRVAKFKAIIAQKIHAMVRPANMVSQGARWPKLEGEHLVDLYI